MSEQKEKTVPCQQCGKLFATQERVKIHIRVTHGVKPACCEVCGSMFSYRCKLIDHMRTHTGDKPFVCDFVQTNEKVCGRAFSQRYHLRRHQMIHTGERPFPCEVCGRGFYRKDKLSRHRRVHTNPGGSRSVSMNSTANQNSILTSNLVTSIGQQVLIPNCGSTSIQIFPVQLDASMAARMHHQPMIPLKRNTTGSTSTITSPQIK
ncbi:uncharacterized protein LOC141851220 [Brevipalpus obovatus]|uniref:uncharacterized protein LOC141851220 n=1 Tax=Brevipalpus obovatus TaxID=246614 RepID=UPI003D9E39B6